MFDCEPTWQEKKSDRKNKVDNIRHFKIVHVCMCCGRKIETFWDNNHELDGRWMAFGVEFSDLFNCFVAWPNKVLCNWCFGTGEWKKRGLNLKFK